MKVIGSPVNLSETPGHESIDRYAETEEIFINTYSYKGIDLESLNTITWDEAKERWNNIIVLSDPGMGKSTLLKMETITQIQKAKKHLEDPNKLLDEIIICWIISPPRRG